MKLQAWVVAVPLLAVSWDVSAAPRDAEQIDINRYHGCAVTSCGEVKCWGRNDSGQSADRNPTVFTPPFGAPIIPKFESVSVGQYHTCALDEDGDVECWGKNNYGQSADRLGPFVQLTTGYNHNCALDAAGNVECWGSDVHGESSEVPTNVEFEDISAGLDFTCGVVQGGAEIQCWGRDTYDQAPTSLAPPNVAASEVWTTVTAGAYHACATTDWQGGDTAYCWGYGPYASLNGFTTEVQPGVFWFPFYDLLDIDAGVTGTMLTRPDGGDPEITGYGSTFASYPVAANTFADDIALDASHWCYVDLVGDLHCEGSNQYGKSTPPSMGGSCPGFLPVPIPGWGW
ncbi:MAG: hypothetical protein AAF721_25685 [Myxococcota bacterium]